MLDSGGGGGGGDDSGEGNYCRVSGLGRCGGKRRRGFT